MDCGYCALIGDGHVIVAAIAILRLRADCADRRKRADFHQEQETEGAPWRRRLASARFKPRYEPLHA